ncbi:acetyltransferase [Lasiosphaeria hispida]|uniref:Acetyltransferase n=1 Tax=Lasiosphaeria hispida TaxID=260671 RepID=A0AAJ0MIL9_9PEZI|nr:acetyltransferase [Lasiosphaeria hispida]
MATPDTLTFRLATAADAPQLTTLINTSFRNDPTTDVFLSLDHENIDIVDDAAVLALLARPEAAVLAVTDGPGGAPVAHCFVRKLDDARAWFGLLAVAVDRQGEGIGGRVVRWAEDYVRREWGVGRLEFDVVNTRAELIRWYERRGFTRTGETREFPYERHGGWEGVLRGDLGFVVFGRDLGVEA